MKFNPLTKEVYTDDGRLLKKMNCPYRVSWNSLAPVSNSPADKRCSMCNTRIIDTAGHTDESLAAIMQNDPDTCLKIDFDQSNIKII